MESRSSSIEMSLYETAISSESQTASPIESRQQDIMKKPHTPLVADMSTPRPIRANGLMHRRINIVYTSTPIAADQCIRPADVFERDVSLHRDLDYVEQMQKLAKFEERADGQELSGCAVAATSGPVFPEVPFSAHETSTMRRYRMKLLHLNQSLSKEAAIKYKSMKDMYESTKKVKKIGLRLW